MKVSVIISNRNDSVMLSITVRSCLEALKPLGGGEIVICDNSDQEIFSSLSTFIPQGYIRDKSVKIIRQNFPCLFSARETAANNASGDYIVCVDSHVIIGHNMIYDLVNFMDRYSDDETLGFAHAPVSWLHQHESRSRHDRDMSVNELGNWGLAYDHDRTITWKGMPWICRREWFLDRDKGLNGYGDLARHKVSWGGGDMHIGVKPWLLGFKNWAVSTSPAIHIGPFPKIDSPRNSNETIVSANPANHQKYAYRLYGTSGSYPHTFGFLVSCYILGGEEMMKRNEAAITNRFGRFINVRKWWSKAIELGEGERQWLQQHQVMTFTELLERKPWDAPQTVDSNAVLVTV